MDFIQTLIWSVYNRNIKLCASVCTCAVFYYTFVRPVVSVEIPKILCIDKFMLKKKLKNLFYWNLCYYVIKLNIYYVIMLLNWIYIMLLNWKVWKNWQKLNWKINAFMFTRILMIKIYLKRNIYCTFKNQWR